MQRSVVILFTCIHALLASVVTANQIAGPYGGMLVWYAYAIDFLRSHADASYVPQIAGGCSAFYSLQGARCSISQLLEYVDEDPDAVKNAKYSKLDSITDASAIDPDALAEALEGSGYSGNCAMDKVYPPYSGLDGYPKWDAYKMTKNGYRDIPGFAKAYVPLTNYLMGGRLVLGDNMPKFVGAGLDYAMQGFFEARIKDLRAYEGDTLKAYLKTKGLDIDVKFKSIDDYKLIGTFDVVDVTATRLANPSTGDALLSALNQYVQDKYLGTDITGTGKLNGKKNLANGHFKAVQAIQDMASDLQRPVAGCYDIKEKL